MKILVTGADGYIASHLIKALLEKPGYQVVATCRSTSKPAHSNLTLVTIPDLCAFTDWTSILHGVDVVVHLVGQMQRMRKTNQTDLERLRCVNVDLTIELARQAIEFGVSRFVYISSIGVNGETSQRPFNETDSPSPKNSYAISKLEAEQALIELCHSSSLEFVIVRPPLVYGPRVSGNFARLVKLAAMPLPLPKAANLKSLLAIENLVSFLLIAIEHRAAANEIFLVSDDDDVSIGQLILVMRLALGRPAWLFPFPRTILNLFFSLPFYSLAMQKLFKPLQIDCGKARSQLNWDPAISAELAVQQAVKSLVSDVGPADT